MMNKDATSTWFVHHLYCTHHHNEWCGMIIHCDDGNKQLTLSMFHLFAMINNMNGINGIYCANTFIVMIEHNTNNAETKLMKSFQWMIFWSFIQSWWIDPSQIQLCLCVICTAFIHHNECMCTINAINVIHCADYCK